MTFSVSVIKEKSADPNFKVRVSIYGSSFCVKNAEVDVLRLPPRVRINYPSEIETKLSETDRKKLDLEILNKVVEHIMQTAEKSELNATAFLGRKR
ncbi:MAG: hypothetical protein GX494_00685 [Clostridiaceae bacterium]|nr:hypothetical protein [Clostridiaceae bacterium]